MSRRILLTNDDGWRAPGIAAMARALDPLGEVVIAAPELERSAVGHGITLINPLEAREATHSSAAAMFVVSGTPADCAKLAVRTLFADRPPALTVSGINRGPNVGVNVFYSGTVAAALESVINGVPAVAVSKEFGERCSFDEAGELVRPLIARVLAAGLPPWHALNVNVPDIPPGDIRGFRLTRQGVSGFEEDYREEPCDDKPCPPEGPSADSAVEGPGLLRRRFRIHGTMRLREPDGLTDAEALAEGYVSVTPLALDLTARGHCAAPGADWTWVLG